MNKTIETSRVLTLVFTDLADSTGLKTAKGDRAVGELIQRHRDHLTQLAGQYSGQIIDWAGDGCFLTFETSSSAVMFALRLQQIHHYEADLPGVRIGVHMGEVSTRSLDDATRVEGLIVDLSARIAGLAQPGQVLISSAVHQSAKQRLGIHEFGQPIRWETYGPYALKGFDEPVDIREAGLESISPLQAPEASEKAWPAGAKATPAVEESAHDAPIRKLAVLPLTNLSGDPGQEYFADGMTEAIITELAKIKALRVISRTSVMRYKKTTLPLKEIARELNVDGLIEGSVLRAGDEVRISAQLIRGDSDEHLWAEHYDGTVENILKLQKDIALSVADEIQVTVSAGERADLRSAKRIDPEAYDLYLKAARFGGDWTPASVQKSLDLLDAVERMAPEFSTLHTLKATAHYFRGMSGYAPSAPSFAESRREARRALRNDETDSGAHTVLAWIAMTLEWDWDEALYRFDQAMALNPSNHFIYSGLGYLYAVMDRLDQALEITRQGVEIDPNNPPTHHMVGMIHFLRREYADALAKLGDSLQFGKRILPPYVDGIIFASCANEHDLALENAATAIELGGRQPHFLAYKAYAHAHAGDKATAESILDELNDYSGSAQVLFMDRAIVNLALGHIDAALDALERAHREREYLVVLIGKLPIFDPLREEPRFQALIDEMNFPDSQ